MREIVNAEERCGLRGCVWGDQGRLQATGSMIYGGDESRSASAGAGTGYGTCAWEESAKQRCMEGGG